MLKIKKYCKVSKHCLYTGKHKGAAHSVCNIKYSVLKVIPMVFHNESNYHYNFIRKGQAGEFE